MYHMIQHTWREGREKFSMHHLISIITSCNAKKEDNNQPAEERVCSKLEVTERKKICWACSGRDHQSQCEVYPQGHRSIRKKFGNRSVAFFHVQYKTCPTKHHIERDTAGGRKQGECSNCILLVNSNIMLLSFLLSFCSQLCWAPSPSMLVPVQESF